MSIYVKICLLGVYLGVRTCELFLCFVAIVRVRVYYVDFFVFFVLRQWWVSQVLTPRQSQILHDIIELFGFNPVWGKNAWNMCWSGVPFFVHEVCSHLYSFFVKGPPQSHFMIVLASCANRLTFCFPLHIVSTRNFQYGLVWYEISRLLLVNSAIIHSLSAC